MSNLPEKLLSALGNLGQLPEGAAVARLEAAFLSTSSMSMLQRYFSKPIDDNLNQWAKADGLCTFDGIDRTAEIKQLGDASMATVVVKVDDQWGFKTLCDADVALRVADRLLASLMSSLFAEHINHHLTDNQLPSLGQLQLDSDFTNGYKTLVTNDTFNPISNGHDPFFAMTVLFVAEYLAKGPGFQLPNEPNQVASREIFTKWQAQADTSSEFNLTDSKSYEKLLARYAYIWSGVVSPRGLASTGVNLLAQTLVTSGVLMTSSAETPMSAYLKNLQESLSSGPELDSDVFKTYKGVSETFWNKWNDNIQDQSPTTFWQQGIRSAEADSSTTNGGGLHLEEYTFTSDLTVNGTDLAAWYASIRAQPYMRTNSELNHIVHTTRKELKDPRLNDPLIDTFIEDVNESISGFAAGTTIRTGRGDVPIEDLREGDSVCTRLQPTQWGVRSSESVQSSSPKLIYGFNQDPAFFTAGHVFHTTTGLRAIRPDIARSENPWIDVGQLAVGHQLLQAVDDDRYELILINSINSESSTSEFVYGVHLREGLRSYHANGYLVALNYPEITVSAIAKRLVSLPPKDRIVILSSMHELKPLFARFGGTTALDVLDREARSSNLSFGGKAARNQEFLTRDLDLPYILSFVDQSAPDVQIELLHGVLTIDGNFCEAASFEKSSLTWTRQLQDGRWEHASCIFAHNGQLARGNLARISSNEENEKSISEVAKAVRLVPGTLATLNHSEPSAVPADRISSLSLEARPDIAGVVTRSLASVERELPMTARVPLVFSLSYDPTPFEPEVSSPNANLRCGNLIVPIENGHYAFPKLRWQDYDIVRDALTKRIQGEQKDADNMMELPDFYRHRVTYDTNDTQHHLFELQHSQALIEASDEFKAWKVATASFMDKEPPTRNLHYTNLGLPAAFQITEILQSIAVERSKTNPNGTITLTGTAYSYSSTSDGNQGALHYIIGTYIRGHTFSPIITPRLLASAVSSRSKRDMTAVHVAPSPHTSVLSAISNADTDQKLQDLTNLALNQSDVNQSAQSMMLSIMQWHIDDSERKLFFNAVDKPTGLPAEFTTEIQNTPTADWIRNMYAKAYMCQVISQNDANIRERYRFTAKEKKAAKYFWDGKGENCLSRSKIYHKLDRAISRYVMRNKYDLIGNIYESGRGVEFSNGLYNWHTDDLSIDQLGTVNQATGTSLLTKICAIMDSLDDGARVSRPVVNDKGEEQNITDTNSNLLVYKSMAFQQSNLVLNQYWGAKSKDAQEKVLESKWLHEALQDLVKKIISQDPSIAGPVSQTLGKEFAEYGNLVQGWGQMSDKEKAQQVSLLIGDRLPKMMEILGKTYGWVKRGATWVYQAGSRLVATWQQNATAAGQAADAIINLQPTGLLKGPVAKSLLVLVGMFAIGTLIWNFSDNWSGGSAADQATMITTVFMGVNELAGFGVDAVYAVMRYRTGVFSEAAELAICTKFDRIMKTQLGTEWATIMVDSNPDYLPKLRALLDAEEASNPLGLNQIRAMGSQPGELTVTESLARLGEMAPVRKAFNVARNALSFVGYVLSIGIAIFLTWQLANDWDKMDLGTRVFETIQVVLTCIEALGAAVVAGAYIAWGVAAIAASSATTVSIGAFTVAAASVFAGFAIVIAGIAVAVLIMYFIWQSKQEPPASPAESWMQTTGKPWTDGHPAPPEALTPYISPQAVDYDSSVQTVNVGFTNNNTTPQVIEYITVSFAGGSSPAALFTTNKGFEVGEQSVMGVAKLTKPGNGCKLTSVNHTSAVVKDDQNTTLTVTAAGSDSTFLVQPGGEVEITMWGVIQADGGQTASVSWVVGSNLDVLNGSLDIARAKKP